MKKAILFLLSALGTFTVHAESTNIVLYRNNFSVNGSTSKNADLACSKQLSQVVSDIEEKLNRNEFDRIINGDVQYGCKKVTLNGKTKTHSSFSSYDKVDINWEAGMLAPFTLKLDLNRDHARHTEVVVTCEPRNLIEKQLFSISRRCEAEPTITCLDKTFLKSIKKLKPTVYGYSYSSGCSI